jgi:Na+-transporting NADH:ubiquinone oxidoreductase subunit NqrD
MIARGGVSGAQRIAQVFPDALRNSGVLVLPSALVVILLMFWLIRILSAKAHKRTASPGSTMVGTSRQSGLSSSAT